MYLAIPGTKLPRITFPATRPKHREDPFGSGLEPFEALRFAEASRPWSSGEKHVVSFLLTVYNMDQELVPPFSRSLLLGCSVITLSGSNPTAALAATSNERSLTDAFLRIVRAIAAIGEEPDWSEIYFCGLLPLLLALDPASKMDDPINDAVCKEIDQITGQSDCAWMELDPPPECRI